MFKILRYSDEFLEYLTIEVACNPQAKPDGREHSVQFMWVEKYVDSGYEWDWHGLFLPDDAFRLLDASTPADNWVISLVASASASLPASPGVTDVLRLLSDLGQEQAVYDLRLDGWVAKSKMLPNTHVPYGVYITENGVRSFDSSFVSEPDKLHASFLRMCADSIKNWPDRTSQILRAYTEERIDFRPLRSDGETIAEWIDIYLSDFNVTDGIVYTKMVYGDGLVKGDGQYTR